LLQTLLINFNITQNTKSLNFIKLDGKDLKNFKFVNINIFFCTKAELIFKFNLLFIQNIKIVLIIKKPSKNLAFLFCRIWKQTKLSF
jgi:hypothetical protein